MNVRLYSVCAALVLSLIGVSSQPVPETEVGITLGGKHDRTKKGLVVISNDPTMVWHMATGGSVNELVAGFRILSDTDGRFTQMGLKLGPYASPQDLLRVTVWDGTTMLDETVFVGTSWHTVVYFPPVKLVANVPKTLMARCDISQIGIAESGRSGHIIQIDYDDEMPQNTVVTRAKNPVPLEVVGRTYSPGVLMVKSYPTFGLIHLTGYLAGYAAIAFSVKADEAGPVGLGKLGFSFKGANISDLNATLYAYTDQSFSQPLSGFGPGGEVGPSQLVSPTQGSVIAVYPQYEGMLRTLEIPPGQKYYFLMRIDSYAAKVGAWLTTTIETEEAGAVIGNFDQLDPVSFGLWTPNSYTLTGYEPDPGPDGFDVNRDWLNTLGVPGLWPNGMSEDISF